MLKSSEAEVETFLVAADVAAATAAAMEAAETWDPQTLLLLVFSLLVLLATVLEMSWHAEEELEDDPPGDEAESSGFLSFFTAAAIAGTDSDLEKTPLNESGCCDVFSGFTSFFLALRSK